MDPNLFVIGLNYRTVPLEVRERFWIGQTMMVEALRDLAGMPGAEEAAILATCNRVEFILWTGDCAAAANSVLDFLVRRHALQLCQWKHFYRLLGADALQHVFRVASSLDSMIVGEPQILGQVKDAWATAQQAGTCGRYLDAVFRKAVTVSRRVRNETAIGTSTVSVPSAAVELARSLLGELRGRQILIIGAGKMGELSARYLLNGAGTVCVTNRTFGHAEELAARLGATAVPFEERWRHLADADVVLTSTGCPHVIISREDAERIRRDRQDRPLYFIDMAMPRDIDPSVREVPGMFVYDLDDLGKIVARNRNGRASAAASAERIVASEAQAFRQQLASEAVAPTLAALHHRLEEIRQQEIARHTFASAEEQRAMDALTSRIVQRIGRTLARELKGIEERPEQERMTNALRRLFQLAPPEKGWPAPPP